MQLVAGEGAKPVGAGGASCSIALQRTLTIDPLGLLAPSLVPGYHGAAPAIPPIDLMLHCVREESAECGDAAVAAAGDLAAAECGCEDDQPPAYCATAEEELEFCAASKLQGAVSSPLLMCGAPEQQLGVATGLAQLSIGAPCMAQVPGHGAAAAADGQEPAGRQQPQQRGPMPPTAFSTHLAISEVIANSGSPTASGIPLSPGLSCADYLTSLSFPMHSMSTFPSSSFTSTTNPQLGNGASACPCPPHGVKACIGKRAKMEDTYTAMPKFFDLPSTLQDDGSEQNKLPSRLLQLDLMSALGHHASTSSSAAATPHCTATGTTTDGSPPSSMPLSPSSGGAGPFCDVSALGSIPVQCDASQLTEGSVSASETPAPIDTLHFYGVYDGHGGTEAATHCAARLHHHLSEAIASICSYHATEPPRMFHVDGAVQDWPVCPFDRPEVLNGGSDGLTSDVSAPGVTAAAAAASSHGAAAAHDHVVAPSPLATASAATAAADADAADSTAAAAGVSDGNFSDTASSTSSTAGSDVSSRSDSYSFSNRVEDAMRQAFLRTDVEFKNCTDCASMVGSTAVVALIGSRKLWVANCGDSRAVLCRGRKAVQLTDDHKPEREDEAERVEKAGGQVLYWNGHRVMGVLAMSRAIGDHGLRPYVIPEPEITVVTRAEDDDFLLLASDGLWDVMPNQEATNLTIRCLERAREKGASRKAAVRIAASVLTKAAIDRGSKDNVTVLIVDLKSPAPEDAESSKHSCSSACSATCGNASEAPTGAAMCSRAAGCSPVKDQPASPAAAVAGR